MSDDISQMSKKVLEREVRRLRDVIKASEQYNEAFFGGWNSAILFTAGYADPLMARVNQLNIAIGRVQGAILQAENAERLREKFVKTLPMLDVAIGNMERALEAYKEQLKKIMDDIADETMLPEGVDMQSTHELWQMTSKFQAESITLTQLKNYVRMNSGDVGLLYKTRDRGGLETDTRQFVELILKFEQDGYKRPKAIDLAIEKFHTDTGLQITPPTAYTYISRYKRQMQKSNT